MRTAVISDIHGNLEALTAVERSIAGEQVDRIVCLGDIVGYGADPGACIDRIRSICSIVVLGNHDAAAIEPSLADRFSSMAATAIIWTRSVLSQDQLTYLRGLPLSHAEGELLFVHASPLDPAQWSYILDAIDARSALAAFSQSVCFIGHTHQPEVFRDRRATGEIRRGERIIVNVGSVGQPRDGRPEACYGLFDDETWEYWPMRVPYDISTAVRKIREAGLPSRLADRLIVGQ
jgi:diadenosine tetraphosphatase ApaH/serine/threonine PP2A family protein phosphatase